MEDCEVSKPEHLCVLVHGLWGNPGHMWYLEKSLCEEYPEDRLHILSAKGNAGNHTYDGIETGGERVAHEIEQELEKLAKKGTPIKKLSVIGYSLGGLVARYAVGLLYHNKWFDERLEPNFTTFATPHLGVRTPLLGFPSTLWNVLGARTLSISGRQLFGIDKFRDTGRPLLSVLADPEGIFIRALTTFKNRSLYANVINDRSAVFYTTAISRTDPYVNIDNLDVNYVPGYEPVVIDGKNPFSMKNAESSGTFSRLRKRLDAWIAKLPMYAFLVFIVPIGVVIFLSNSVIQSVASQQRIRLHQTGKTGVDVSKYRIPLLQNMRETAETLYENVNSAQDQEYLPVEYEDAAVSHGSSLLLPEPSKAMSQSSGKSTVDTEDPQVEVPTLALTDEQFAMIDALDKVGWKKYHVWIHKARHSHAAVIVRMNEKRFNEGKVVVRHWLSEFEL
ncbi:putative lipase/serine esterase [Trichodelitschia bisporula]|uniref:Putative lipase/serine esterase n=1 Tax=Trichodelitschia bisporula TaxID=703511 RepID=A0A6G1HPT6_9PEZI|nr:putative lipase/serine esterase [Trichodelitschia bisporula]